uniref:putative bifunctional diguanylate cyclase/phosphodiesterase n=1 Tax=Mycobacterium simiae TaxID=1784 RepID=UPI00261E6304
EARVIRSPSVAIAPLLSGGVTTGVLGFGKFRGTHWQRDELSMIQAIAALLAQLQARITAENKLRHLADHDDLTGLCNRRALVAHLANRLSADSPGPIAALYIDLDRLKAINDFFGHSVGDAFIKSFADQLRHCAKADSVIARLGGDEFVVVPHHVMASDRALRLAERLVRDLAAEVTIDGHTLTRTVSIGLAAGQPGRDDATALLRRADEAVLAAKRAGGNQVVVADDSALQQLLRNAVHHPHRDGDDTEGLALRYLPDIDLETNAIVATEALLRWQHPTRGLLGPDFFIPIAESMNLADELGRWVLRCGCADFTQWQTQGIAERAALHVNVSPLQLAGHNLASMVADTIAEFKISPASLCLDITERALIHDMNTTRRTLHDLKDIGVRIAIDDFGAGHIVLSHLQQLPIDILKIDAGFTRRLDSDSADLAVIRAIVGLAHAFNLDLVAEGVETRAAAQVLRHHGCRRAQGFLFSHPVPRTAMRAMLSNKRLPVRSSEHGNRAATKGAAPIHDT